MAAPKRVRRRVKRPPALTACSPVTQFTALTGMVSRHTDVGDGHLAVVRSFRTPTTLQSLRIRVQA